MTHPELDVRTLVVAVDVGSIARGNFAWSTDDESDSGRNDPSALGQFVASALNSDRQVALAFECPLSVPVPSVDGDAWQGLGRARTGETDRAWSAGSGATILPTGLVQMAWILAFIKHNSQGRLRVTTNLHRFLDQTARLFVAEAMVTADGKPVPVDGHQHHADAHAAAVRLRELLEDGFNGVPVDSDVSCDQSARALNLAAAAAMHAGLEIDSSELTRDVLVAKARPA